jgi:hypothetical protein
MFKILCLVSILVLMFAVGGAWGFEENQECEMLAGSKVFMMVSPNTSVPVMPNGNITVTLGEEITEGLVKFFNEESALNGVTQDFAGGRIAQDIAGKIIVIKPTDVINCK